jgi:murein DD-endopeptidase MepM/ murein hydrolase activator NlpD
MSYVVRRNPPGGRKKSSGPNLGAGLALFACLAISLIFGGLLLTQGATSAAPGIGVALAITPLTPVANVQAPLRRTPEPLPPTSTFLPPSPSPTALTSAQVESGPTITYLTQSGDTLAAVAARFGVNPEDIRGVEAFAGQSTLPSGQPLIIPRVLGETGPADKIVPDSEVVFGPTAADFDAAAFATQQGGYLARYRGFVDELTRKGGDVVQAIGQQHSINPRILLALLEHQSGWVSNPSPDPETFKRPLGYRHPYRTELNAQLNWAAHQLEIGYYGWRMGTLTELTFPDGSKLRLDPTLNAGTAALQYFFAQLYNRPQWDEAVGYGGLGMTYRRLFGDPSARAFEVLPADLTQPPLAFPFQRGQTWFFTGGPHGAWENGGAQAALDFAPSSLLAGCTESSAWVTAMAAGRVLRSEAGAVVIDLDGDGRETTGWVIFYFHLADENRVAAGALVERGDKIGHPSCVGGRSTGTHVHIARKYNGEWVPAAGAVPFNLEGWVARAGPGEYLGTLERNGFVVEACTCASAATAVTAGR